MASEAKDTGPVLIKRPSRSGYPTTFREVPGREALEKENAKLKAEVDACVQEIAHLRVALDSGRARLGESQYEIRHLKELLFRQDRLERGGGRPGQGEVILQDKHGFTRTALAAVDHDEYAWPVPPPDDLNLSIGSYHPANYSQIRRFQFGGKRDEVGRRLFEEV